MLDTVTFTSTANPEAAAATFERAYEETGAADLEDFLPPSDDPEYPSVLAELLRVDMRMNWSNGRRRYLDDYRTQYPAALADPKRLAAVAQEEYQARVAAGDAVEPEEYESRYGVDISGWLNPRSDALICLPADRTRTIPPTGSKRLRAALAAQEKTARSSVRPTTPGEMPRAGQKFLHFDLVKELGRGVFGRVFLAHQTQLADRPVALKITAESDAEPQLLARLQHTNIVPIYAVYQAGPLQAICMPYFGSITLSRVIADLARDPRQLPQTGRGLLSTLFETRLNGAAITKTDEELPPPATDEPPSLAALGKMSQVNAALWIAARLADGLAHAHERGILHCDLKPANVLIADDGQPMLLDFNVAADRHALVGRKSARLGGTLPYMAPEYLNLLHNDNGQLTPQCDLFSLGVVLHELLTGADPYPDLPGDVTAPVSCYLAAHSKLPEPPSRKNPAVTPAVDAIVLKLLDPDPSRRYAEAAHVREDLERQLADRPLAHTKDPSIRERVRKWRRRNPKLTTGIAVALVAVLFLILPATALAIRSEQIAVRQQELARSEALLAQQHAVQELRTAQVLLASRTLDPVLIAEGFDRAQAILKHYAVETDAGWTERAGLKLLSAEQQSVLRREMGGALLMCARAEMARRPAGDAAAAEAALKWNRLAETCYPTDAQPKLLARQRQALAALLPGQTEALPEPLGQPVDAFYDGYDLFIAGRPAEALQKLVPFTDEQPSHFLAWYVRGLCHEAVAQYPESAGAFTVCTTLWPDFAWSYFSRGVARLRQGKMMLAEADFTRALDRRPNWAEAYLNRSIAREGKLDHDGAIADLNAALERPNAPTRGYFLRSRIRKAKGDKVGAELDAAEGHKQEPKDATSWITRGFWKHESDAAGAIADYDAALKLNPRSADALKNKAIVLADFLNKPADAVAIMDQLLEMYPYHTEARAGRAVYLARQGEAKRAAADAAIVLKEEPTPFRLYQMAGMYAQLSKTDKTGTARQQALQLAAKAFRTGFDQFKVMATDPDIDPLRDDVEFKQLVEHAQKLQRTVR